MIADYRVSESDELHRHYIVHASFMAILYCAGIPIVSWFQLRPIKKLIQKLQTIDKVIAHLESEALESKDGLGSMNTDQSVLPTEAGENNSVHRMLESTKQRRKSIAFRAVLSEATVVKQCSSDVGSFKALKGTLFEDNPMLAGLSPLYKDHSSERWWFQMPNFIVTLCLCGLVTLIGSDGVSQVFLSLFISGAYTLLLANIHPHANGTDNLLAQFCQGSLTFALAVNVVEQVETSSRDSAYGPLLIICTVVNLVTGALLVAADFLKEAFPDQFEILCAIFARWWLQLKRWFTWNGNLVAPEVDASSSGMPPSEGNTDFEINNLVQAENSDHMTTQAGNLEGGAKNRSKEQRMPSSVETDRSAEPAFTENEEGNHPIQIVPGITSNPARTGRDMLPPMTRPRPNVQKMPGADRNLESLTSTELKRLRTSSQM